MRHRPGPSTLAHPDWLWPSGVAALGAFAFRDLFREALAVPSLNDMESWFFTPGKETGLLVLGISGWLLWRRRERLVSLPVRNAAAPAIVLLSVATALFVWAHLNETTDLQFASLAAALLSFATAARGWAGIRCVLLPALVLLFGLRIPAPLESELVWHLQIWTTSGAAFVLGAFGLDTRLGDVLLGVDEQIFLVIESCSGLRGIQILTLAALVVREWFATRGARIWLLVLGAPILGYVANVLRVIAVILVTGDPRALAATGGDHTPQGLAVVIGGSALLYIVGWLLAGRQLGREPAVSLSGERDAIATLPWKSGIAWCATMTAFSVLAAPFPEPQPQPLRTDAIPERRSGWTSEALPLDREFWSYLRDGHVLFRRYEKDRGRRAPDVVEVFLGFERIGYRATSRLFSSKTRMPGSEWSIRDIEKTRVWLLNLDAEVTIAARESTGQLALVYIWHLRDENLVRETARAQLALNSSPWRRPRERVVVRLVTPLVNESADARDRAKQSIDRFIKEFRTELAAL